MLKENNVNKVNLRELLLDCDRQRYKFKRQYAPATPFVKKGLLLGLGTAGVLKLAESLQHLVYGIHALRGCGKNRGKLTRIILAGPALLGLAARFGKCLDCLPRNRDKIG